MYQYRVCFSQKGCSELRGEYITADNFVDAAEVAEQMLDVDEGVRSLEFIGRSDG